MLAADKVPTLTDPNNQLVDDHAIAAILPVHRATRIALRTRPRDPLPAFIVGRRVFYRVGEVLNWISRQRERHAPPARPPGRPRKNAPEVRPRRMR